MARLKRKLKLTSCSGSCNGEIPQGVSGFFRIREREAPMPASHFRVAGVGAPDVYTYSLHQVDYPTPAAAGLQADFRDHSSLKYFTGSRKAAPSVTFNVESTVMANTTAIPVTSVAG